MQFLKRSFFLIGKKNRNIFFLVLLLSSISMILEMLSLGLIIPLLTSLQSIEGENLKIINIINNFNFLNISLTNFILTLIFIIFLIKLFFFVGFIFIKNSFSYRLLKELLDRLYENYLNQDYNFFLKKNSSELTRNIGVQAEVFIDQGIRAIIDLFTEIIIVTGILIILLFYNFQLTISVIFVLSIFLIIFNLLTKKRSKYFASLKIDAIKQIMKLVNEAVYGNILIKVSKSESYFLNLFKKYSTEVDKSSRYYESYFELPKYFLEFVAILVILLVFVLINILNIETNPITLLSLYAAAGFKLMPTLNRILTCIHKIRFGRETLNILYEDLQNDKNNKVKNNDHEQVAIKNFSNLIELKNISFKFLDEINNEKKIFQNLNFKILKGETLGIIGESGSGKTTLLNLILGLLKPDKGKVLFDGKDITKKKTSFKNLVGYVSQNTFLLDAPIRNNIAFGERPEDIKELKVIKALQDAQLGNFLNTLPNGIDTLIGENGTQLSGGQRQRLSIARALYFDPQILIFDEATNSLDEKNEEKFLNVVKKYKLKKTIIIVSHGKKALKLADSLYEIKAYRLNKI